MKMRWIAVTAVLAGPVMAQQDATVDARTVRACFAEALPGDVAPDCLGAASNVCQQAPGGSTTIGITDCIVAETAVWDVLLNELYAARRGEFERADALEERSAVDRTDALRDAQRAWIAFRDANCLLAFARWQVGSIRHVVGANCHLTMTAQRAIELRDMKGN